MGIASYIIPFIFALILHGGLLLLLIPHWFQQEDPYRRMPRHIQAEMIDLKALSNQENLQKEFQEEQKLKAEQEKKREKIAQEHQQALKKQELEKQNQEAETQHKIAEAQQKEAEAQQKSQAEKQRKAAEDKKLAKLKEQQVIEHARKIAAEAELKKKEELKEKEKKVEAQKLADAKKKVEADKKSKAEDARKKADEEKKRKNDELKSKEAERKLAEEKKHQQEADRVVAENAAKRKAAAAERSDKMRAEISGYIQALIEKNWRYPSNTRNGMKAKVLIRLFPSGEVDSVEIMQSSGDAAFDKSAEQAVLRIGKFTRVSEVDPLFFERELRRVIIEFRPEGLRW